MPLLQHLGARQRFQRAVEPGGLFEPFHLTSVHPDQIGGLDRGDLQSIGLSFVVGQDEVGHRVGHVGEERVARRSAASAPVAIGALQEDLDVHLVVGRVDPGRVVDGVGVDAPARERVLDPGPLGEPEIAALADDPAPQLGGVDAHRVVGAVPDVGVGLGGRLHEGADPAVPEQVDRRPEDRADHVVGRERASTSTVGGDIVEAEHAAGGVRQVDRLRRAGTRRHPARAPRGRSRPTRRSAARTAAAAPRTTPTDRDRGRRTRDDGRTRRRVARAVIGAIRCRTRHPTCRRCRRPSGARCRHRCRRHGSVRSPTARRRAT